MSARLLANPGKVHEISDDIESFVHVLRWMCLRFYPHSMTGLHDQLRHHVMSHFESYDIRSGEDVAVGGVEKKAAMLDGVDVVRLKAANSPLGKLLDELRWICQEHYRATEPAPRPVIGASQAKPPLVHFKPKPRERWMQGEAQRSSAASHSSNKTEQRRPTLANHNAVGYALVAAYMDAEDAEWNVPVKTADQFAHPRYKSAL